MRRLTAVLTGLLLGAPFLSENLLAAEWEKEAGVSVGTEFSDNLCLSNDDKSARTFATVTPDIRVRGRGSRATLDLIGSLKYSTLGGRDSTCSNNGQRSIYGNRETWRPNLRYRGEFDLINNWLTLESDASARTTNIDPFAPGNTDSFDGLDNVNVTYQYGAGARIQRRVLDNAAMLLRYNYNEQHNAVRILGDSSESLGEFTLSTERANNRLTLGISGRYSKVLYDGTTLVSAFDNTLSSSEARASLRLSPSWQTNVMVGEEWNEFTNVQPDIDGSYWDVGLRWSPNDRVEVNVGTGERFFGITPRMSIRYRHKRSELSADYNRSLTLPRDLRSASGRYDFPFDTDFINGENSSPSQFPSVPSTTDGETTFIGNTPVINERLNLRYRYSTRRNTVSITASNSRQKRLEDLNEATFSRLALALSRTLSSTLSVNMNLALSEREGRGGSVGVFSAPSQTWHSVLGLNRRLGNNTTMSMNYQYTLRKSDSDFGQYEENRITISARHQF